MSLFAAATSGVAGGPEFTRSSSTKYNMSNSFLFKFSIIEARVGAPIIVGNLRWSSRFGFHDPSIVHVRNGIGVMKDTSVMRNDNDGPGRIDGVVGKQFHHGFAGSVVERSRGLITKNQPWF